MKTLGLRRTVLLLIMIIGGMRVNAQQLDAEVPGYNFSLEGALELFKKSDSPEAFEKLLNSSDSKVNNLDLNGDGYIDYIRVIDRNEGNVHAFILQAVISNTESQDVAVIELGKLGNGEAVLQITGDADVYGIETIIEPTDEVRVNAGATTTRRVVNVWTWPSVQYIYSPYYTSVWVSPWHWTYRPVWYRPWRPVAYHVYSPYWRPYRSYYSVCYTHRITYAHQLYRPYRTTSVIVYNRHHSTIKHYRSTRHDYDHNGRYKYADNKKRSTRGDSRYGDNRSNGQQHDRRSTTSYTGRQNDSQRKYTDSNSRSSYDRRSQESGRSDNSKRDFRGNTPTASRNESTSMNRSFPTSQQRSSDSQRNTTRYRSIDTDRKPSNNGNTVGSRTQTTRPTSNSGSRQQVTRPSSQVDRRAPTSSSSERRSGSSRNQNNAGKSTTNKSKKGGQ